MYLARIFHELLSRDHEDGRTTWQPQGVGFEAYLIRYVAGADTRGRQEGRPYPWSQQVIHDISGLWHGFFAAKINLARNVELLVFFYHPNDLGGIEMSNPRLRKSQITEIEISVFLVAIRAKHRFG
jgi:hypothetical protein